MHKVALRFRDIIRSGNIDRLKTLECACMAELACSHSSRLRHAEFDEDPVDDSCT